MDVRPVKMRLLKMWFRSVSGLTMFCGIRRRSRFGTIKTKKSSASQSAAVRDQPLTQFTCSTEYRIAVMQNCEAVAIGLSIKHSALFRSQNPIWFATPLHHTTLSLSNPLFGRSKRLHTCVKVWSVRDKARITQTGKINICEWFMRRVKRIYGPTCQEAKCDSIPSDPLI